MTEKTDRQMRKPSHMRSTDEAVPTEETTSSQELLVGVEGKLTQRLFLAGVVVLLLAPLICMPFFVGDASSEKRALADPPQLTVDGNPNWAFLSDAGDYFADHFAFRSLMIDLDATLKQRLFVTSATPNVVVGTDGWLYYAGTLNDYQRRHSMSDHAIQNAATNISLMQESLLARGKKFLFAIAPNKSTLFPQNMPYYELKGEGASNYERLLPQLQALGVNVLDLREPLLAGGQSLYYERDSHWNEEGALVAYNSMVAALGGVRETYETSSSVTTEHEGDVDGMLHPVFVTPEEQIHREGTNAYVMLGDATSVEDAYIFTNATGEVGQDSLLMYRDSFGNNLLGPFASTYRQAVFTKLVPYDMGDEMVGFAQDVIVERAERHIPFFASDPPYLDAPERSLEVQAAPVSSETSVSLSRAGKYLEVSGMLDENVVSDSDRVFVELTNSAGDVRAFEAFHVSTVAEEGVDFEDEEQGEELPDYGDWGYRMYTSSESFNDPDSVRVRILVGNASSCFEVAHT